jgi:VWFA-related protein
MRLRWLVACALATSAAAQDSTFSADVNLVNVYATVLDPNGRTIRDLSKEDFGIEEDGKPQTIRYFSKEFNAPISIGLLIETCNTPRNLELEKNATYPFLDNVLTASDKAFVLDLGHGVGLVLDFTAQRELLREAIAGLTLNVHEAGGCRMLQGVQQGSEMMRPENGRKALILLAQGSYHESKVSIANAIEFAQRGDAIIYAIPFQPRLVPWYLPGTRVEGSMWERVGTEKLQRLARETGGEYLPVTKDQPIDKIYARIEEQLRAQYVIGYKPDPNNPNRGYRKLHLTVSRRAATVRAREGYYPK